METNFDMKELSLVSVKISTENQPSTITTNKWHYTDKIKKTKTCNLLQDINAHEPSVSRKPVVNQYCTYQKMTDAVYEKQNSPLLRVFEAISPFHHNLFPYPATVSTRNFVSEDKYLTMFTRYLLVKIKNLTMFTWYLVKINT